MNTTMLWMGILPVIAFVVLDSFTGKKTALLGALALGVLEVVYSLVAFGGIDYLTVLSFIILAALIGISLKNNNDIFFKVQSAVINVFMGLVLVIAQYGFHKIILLDMTRKYLGMDKLLAINPALTEAIAEKLLTALNGHLPWWLFAHSALLCLAAFKWNKWAWVAVRVPIFYLMLFVMMFSISRL